MANLSHQIDLIVTQCPFFLGTELFFDLGVLRHFSVERYKEINEIEV